MRKLYLLLPILFLIYWGCEDTTPTEVTLWGEVYSVEDTDTLNLESSGLTGSIPPGIGNLTNLTLLDLRNNQLTGSIPSEIGNLTNLTILRLEDNQLTGEIPESICDLNLKFWIGINFNVNNNQLCPPYPSCIGVYLGGQDISDCDTLPPGYVNLWDNFYSIENTTSLDLGNIGLTGEIPPEIGNLTNLTHFDLLDNELTGTIPSEIGNLTNLTYFFLCFNQITGSIPSEIGNLTYLDYLEIKNNQLTGSIPSEIGNLTNLTYLKLSSNQLTGEIPESICDLNLNWSSSSSFNITNNQLCPPYPTCVEDYVAEQDTTNCN